MYIVYYVSGGHTVHTLTYIRSYDGKFDEKFMNILRSRTHYENHREEP